VHIFLYIVWRVSPVSFNDRSRAPLRNRFCSVKVLNTLPANSNPRQFWHPTYDVPSNFLSFSECMISTLAQLRVLASILFSLELSIWFIAFLNRRRIIATKRIGFLPQSAAYQDGVNPTLRGGEYCGKNPISLGAYLRARAIVTW
jgi:hypothetical protein